MPLRAIDFHVHLPTPDWLDGSMAGYVEAAGAYFRSPVQRQSLAELAARYPGLGLMAVLLAWDAETATGRPRVPNETVAAACRDHPGVFTGLGSVDPHKGPAARGGGREHRPARPARREVPPVPAGVRSRRPAVLAGLRRVRRTRPARLVPHRDERHRRPAARRAGIRIDYAHPLRLDPVAAAHPGLTVVAAHFGWPWQMDLIAVALHKTNVHIDISGWSSRRVPAEVTGELTGRLSGHFVWGSDYPFIPPGRCLSELDGLGLTAEVQDAVLRANAARILGLDG